MSDLAERKAAARAAAAEARVALHRDGAGRARMAAGHALAAIAPLHGARVVAGYLPMRSEIDPLPAMLALLGLGYRVAAPVTVARGAPLRFRDWRPGVPVMAGSMGERVPAEGDWLEPEVVLAPLLAFDPAGWRLGYGGGYYDRTLADLRERGGLRLALGLAYAGQATATTPHGDGDARLDAVATEVGVVWAR